MPRRLACEGVRPQFALKMERSTMSAGVRSEERGFPTKASHSADLSGWGRSERGVKVDVDVDGMIS